MTDEKLRLEIVKLVIKLNLNRKQFDTRVKKLYKLIKYGDRP